MISTITKKQISIKKLIFVGFLLGMIGVIGLFGMALCSPPPPLVQLPLGDGRILQIEGVTYGTNHRM